MAQCYTRPMSTKRLQLVTIIIIVVFFVFSGLSIVIGAQYSPQMCPVDYEYNRQVNKCYKVHTDVGKDWNSAIKQCQHYGADIAVVHNYKTRNIIRDFLTDNDICIWTTLDMNNKHLSEPQCFALSNTYERHGECSLICNKYICEKKAEMSPLCPFGYVSNARKDICYKVQKKKNTFEKSRSLCQQEGGGDLVTITDAETMEFIIYLLDPLVKYIPRYWIGLKDKGNNEFDESSLHNSDYASCATLEFYRARYMYTDGKCSQGLPSICQANISTTYPILDCPLGYTANVMSKAGLTTCLMIEEYRYKTWSQAKNICSSVGGELFAFDSDDFGFLPSLRDFACWRVNESFCYFVSSGKLIGVIFIDEESPYICRHWGYIRMPMNLNDSVIISNQEQIVDDVCQSPNGTMSFSLKTLTLMKYLQQLVEVDKGYCVDQKGQDKCCAEVTFSKPGLDQPEIEMKIPIDKRSCLCPAERNEEIASPIKKETFSLLRNITTPKNDSAPQNNLCPCRCDSLKIDFNPSPEALSLMIANIQKELKVETEKLSSKRNKKISAKDNRVESSAIGYLGIALCLIPLGLLVAIDIARLFQPRN